MLAQVLSGVCLKANATSMVMLWDKVAGSAPKLKKAIGARCWQAARTLVALRMIVLKVLVSKSLQKLILHLI